MNTGARLEAIRRLTWLGAGLLLWAVLILAKLISLQVVHHETYLTRARKQQEQSVSLSAPRGAIFDRNGRTLAMSVPADTVAVNPRLVPDKQMAAEVIAPILNLDPNQLYAQLSDAADRRRGFLILKHRVSDDESERLRNLKVDWILFEPESKRIYPDNPIAAHIVGSVYRGGTGADEGVEKGAEGLEKGVEDILKGTSGEAEMLTDVKRRGIDSWVKHSPVPGKSLKIAIDERLQFLAERELAAQVELKHGRSGTVIFMNPYNGEVLVLANYPSFDPDVAPRTDKERKAHFNLGAQLPFEPGSIFKVATLATALETTDIRPETMINCHNGALALPGRVVHEAHGGFGMLSMADVLAKSSNIGAIEIGARIGRERFYQYLQNFGFGKRTGVRLPAESHGILRTLDKWGTTSLASVSMGQEVAATSLQLIRLCAAVANGGLLVQPRLVLEIDGKPVPLEATQRVLRPQTTVTMRTLMEGVVLRGTGRNVIKLNGWTAGGKTGTAQIFEDKHYTHLYNASFMGFAPVNNPALVAIVTINGTTGNAGMGGPTAGPVWTKVMNEALRLFNVPKDLPEVLVKDAKPVKPEEFNEVAEVEGDPGKNILEDDPSALPRLDDVPAAEQITSPAAVVTAALATPAPPAPVAVGPVAPDFRGKPMRAVVREAYAMGLSIKPEGSGLARTQLPAAGAPIRPGDTIRVLFTR